MEDIVNELLSFMENDAKNWDEAALRCEELGKQMGGTIGAQWHLFCAVYRERAEMHREMVAKMRQRLVN